MSYDVTYMQNLKRNDTDELIYKTERDSDLKNTVMVAGVRDVRKGQGGSVASTWTHCYILNG